MQAVIKKYEVSIICFDTHFIIALFRALNSLKGSYLTLNEAKEVLEISNKLCLEGKLVCPIGDHQMEEIENGQKFVKEIRELKAKLSLGVEPNHFMTVEDLQTQRAIKSYAKNEENVEYPYNDIFAEDPSKKVFQNRQFILDVFFNSTKQEIKKRKRRGNSIANDWSNIKKAKPYTLIDEYNGRIGAVEKIVNIVRARMIAKQELTETEFNVFDNLVAVPLSWLDRYTGITNTVDSLKDFYYSEYYRSIPIVDIDTKLVYDLIHIQGSKKPTPSDISDFHYVSEFLPFANFLVVDKHVKERLSTLKLCQKYQCKAITWNEVLPVLRKIFES